jgi:Ca2+-binding RTX toxin-like protein
MATITGNDTDQLLIGRWGADSIFGDAGSSILLLGGAVLTASSTTLLGLFGSDLLIGDAGEAMSLSRTRR